MCLMQYVSVVNSKMIKVWKKQVWTTRVYVTMNENQFVVGRILAIMRIN